MATFLRSLDSGAAAVVSATAGAAVAVVSTSELLTEFLERKRREQRSLSDDRLAASVAEGRLDANKRIQQVLVQSADLDLEAVNAAKEAILASLK